MSEIRCGCGFMPEDETKLECWTRLTLEIIGAGTSRVRYVCPECTKALLELAKLRRGH